MWLHYGKILPKRIIYQLQECCYAKIWWYSTILAYKSGISHLSNFVYHTNCYFCFQLYCCPQYERFVKFELAQRSDTAHLVDEMIDIKPHPPYGTKAARRAAKERAAERAREREMERQRAAGANPTNFYACELTQLRLHASLSRYI